MMAQDIFLGLLKAGLWQKALPALDAPLSKEEWRGVFDLAVKQSLDGIIYDGMMMLPEEQRPDRILQLKWHGRVNKTEQMHHILNHALVEAVDRLEKEGIPALLLKGQGNASFYENPLRRQCGDIDLLIGRKNYERACRLMISWGMSHVQESVKHLDGEWLGTHVELHRIAAQMDNPIGQRRLVGWSEALLADRSHMFVPTFETHAVAIPQPDFNVFFVFFHLLHHFASVGIGLRQFCDLARLLHVYHGQLDLCELSRRIESFGLMRQWQVVGCLLVHSIGLPQEECPFYKDTRQKSEMILRMVIHEGNFGLYSKEQRGRRYTSYLGRKCETLLISTKRHARLMGISPGWATRSYLSFVFRGTVAAIKGLVIQENEK